MITPESAGVSIPHPQYLLGTETLLPPSGATKIKKHLFPLAKDKIPFNETIGKKKETCLIKLSGQPTFFFWVRFLLLCF